MEEDSEWSVRSGGKGRGNGEGQKEDNEPRDTQATGDRIMT